MGCDLECGIIKEGGNQNKVKSMANQLLAKFEESTRNPSLLKQVSHVRCPSGHQPAENPAEVFRLVGFQICQPGLGSVGLRLLPEKECTVFFCKG